MAISFRASFVAVGLLLAPLAANAQQTVVVTNLPPPAIRAETPSPSPGPGFSWVAGFWAWNGTAYNWTAGHWERPPQAGHTWEAPRWEHEGNRYRFQPGRWAGGGNMMQPQPAMPVAVAQPVMAPPVMAPPPSVIQTQMAPPRPRMERRPRMIPPGQTWVPGYWSWNNTEYVWTAGHLEAPPRPRAVWVPPQMAHRGRNWVVTPGRWR